MRSYPIIAVHLWFQILSLDVLITNSKEVIWGQEYSPNEALLWDSCPCFRTVSKRFQISEEEGVRQRPLCPGFTYK